MSFEPVQSSGNHGSRLAGVSIGVATLDLISPLHHHTTLVIDDFLMRLSSFGMMETGEKSTTARIGT